jgi:hypothetical protein
MTMTPHDAAYWRNRAGEARRVAETLTSRQARAHMIECARAYERLALLAEKTAAARAS